MTISLLIGIGILVVCGGVGLALVFYLAGQQDKRNAHIQSTLNQTPKIWSSILLDPKFNTRAFLQKSYRFGDLAVHMTPEGMLLNDGGTLHWLEQKPGSVLASLAKKKYPVDFIAMHKNYIWVQGGKGKFQIRGALSKGLDFRPLAKEWGWEVYDGIPEGAELPKRFKG